MTKKYNLNKILLFSILYKYVSLNQVSNEIGDILSFISSKNLFHNWFSFIPSLPTTT